MSIGYGGKGGGPLTGAPSMPFQTWDEEGKSKREIKPYSKGNYVGIYPRMLKRLAMRCKFGEMKYGDPMGYRYPRPTSTYWDSAMRHMVEYREGSNEEDHLAAAIWNMMAMMFNEEEATEFVDFESRKDKDGTYTFFAKAESTKGSQAPAEV